MDNLLHASPLIDESTSGFYTIIKGEKPEVRKFPLIQTPPLTASPHTPVPRGGNRRTRQRSFAWWTCAVPQPPHPATSPHRTGQTGAQRTHATPPYRSVCRPLPHARRCVAIPHSSSSGSVPRCACVPRQWRSPAAARPDRRRLWHASSRTRSRPPRRRHDGARTLCTAQRSRRSPPKIGSAYNFDGGTRHCAEHVRGGVLIDGRLANRRQNFSGHFLAESMRQRTLFHRIAAAQRQRVQARVVDDISLAFLIIGTLN